MVRGYQCNDCGVQSECGVDEIGERICPECSVAVTGIVGTGRKPDENGMISGEIKWEVYTGYNKNLAGYVSAFDWDEAADQAMDMVDDETITEIRPAHRQDRRHPF